MTFETQGITRKYFDGFSFLTRCIDNTDFTRKFMSVINIETINDTVSCVTTDGRAMHVVEYKKDDFPLDDGIYEVKVNVKNTIVIDKVNENDYGHYPNWKRIVKSAEENINVIGNYCLTFNDLKNKTKTHSFYELIFILNNLGYCFNHLYLQSIALMNRSWDIMLNPYVIGSVMKFVSENHFAFIMPYTKETLIYDTNNAFEILDKTLKSVSDKSELFDIRSVVRRKKYLWEE